MKLTKCYVKSLEKQKNVGFGEREKSDVVSKVNYRVAVVGLDGSGKSTLVNDLEEWLVAAGTSVVKHELQPLRPFVSSLISATRACNRDGAKRSFGIPQFLSAILAIKWQSLWNTLENEGVAEVSLHDRYSYCFIAASLFNLDGRSHAHIERLFGQFPEPDLVIFLDTPPEIAFQRGTSRDGGDGMDIDFLFAHRAAYQTVLSDLRHRVIDGSRTQKEIWQDVTSVFEEEFNTTLFGT